MKFDGFIFLIRHIIRNKQATNSVFCNNSSNKVYISPAGIHDKDGKGGARAYLHRARRYSCPNLSIFLYFSISFLFIFPVPTASAGLRARSTRDVYIKGGGGFFFGLHRFLGALRICLGVCA